MSEHRKPQSLQALVDSVPNLVDHLYKNPPKAALNVFTVMMPAEVVRPEFTTWRDEQRSWRETIALHDQSYHMHNLHVRGRDALRLLERLGVNSFKTFAPGAAKQFLACSPEGYVIGDGILYYLDQEHLLLVGNPATTDWVQFNGERGGYDVRVELDPMWVVNRARKRSFYRYQAEGPHALKLLEKLHGGPLPEISFFRSGSLGIAGCKVRAMRHSMGGVPGLELSGPWEDRDKVKSALVETGRDFGLRRLVENGPMASHIDLPVSATSRLRSDEVLDANGKMIGLVHHPGYSVNERAMMSLGSIEEAYAKPGTEVVLVWGEEGGGRRSAPWIEPHVQLKIRAKVAPAPISQATQAYWNVVKAPRQAVSA